MGSPCVQRVRYALTMYPSKNAHLRAEPSIHTHCPLMSTGTLSPVQAHLEQYGITVTQVTVGDPSPESLLEKLLIDKKKLVGARIRAVQEQDTAQAEAKTAQVHEFLWIGVSLATKVDTRTSQRRTSFMPQRHWQHTMHSPSCVQVVKNIERTKAVQDAQRAKELVSPDCLVLQHLQPCPSARLGPPYVYGRVPIFMLCMTTHVRVMVSNLIGMCLVV